MSEKEGNLSGIIESILFTSGVPVDIKKISKIVQKDETEVNTAINLLRMRYKTEKSGLMIIEKEGKIQLVTNPLYAKFIEELQKSQLQAKLTRAPLEVLSIIAYRGPVSRTEIDTIRGVNCSSLVRTLLLRGLIERIQNQSDTREYLYKISTEFLKEMGLEKVNDLPEYEKIRADKKIEKIVEHSLKEEE